jgi:hypothetical protein
MPLVSEIFIKNAQALAEAVPALQAKLAETEKKAAEAAQKPVEKTAAEALAPLAEATADTLIANGLIPANEKSAAVANLLDHEQALQALNKTASFVRPESMGGSESEKSASTGSNDSIRPSDRQLLQKLGFNV